jgi:Regulator of chromosome condensation (RCC1) repeat
VLADLPAHLDSYMSMDNINIHVYGWGEDVISNHWVKLKMHKEVPIFNLGTQDCTLRWTSPASTNSEKTILHRRFNEEFGLLELFMSTIHEPSIIAMSNSNNHVVYTTPRESLWSFDSRKEAVPSSSVDPEECGMLCYNSAVSESIQLSDAAEPKAVPAVVPAPISDTVPAVASAVVSAVASAVASAVVSDTISGRQAGEKSLYKDYRHTLISIGRAISQIAAGESHCLVIADGNVLYSFGTGSCGELGIESTPSYANTLQLVRLPNNDGVKYIAAGSYYSAAISVTGILYTFGCGAYYRLGHGTDENCNVPRKVEALEGVGMPGPHGTSSGKITSDDRNINFDIDVMLL